VLQRSLQDAKDRGAELEGYIIALLAKKREMEATLQDFIAARAASPTPTGSAPSARATQGKVERAGSAFDRVLARHSGVAGATSPLNPDASKLRELQELARNHRIEERLAALRAAKSNHR
jgi:phage shock protein A